MVAVTAWSYSRYSLYEQCPLQFKLKNIDKVPEPPSAALVKGRKIHDDLKDYLNDKGPKPETQHFHALIDEVKAFPDKLVEHQQGFTAKWEPCGWFGKTTWYRQIYDVALLYEDLTAEAVDWKSGRRYSSNDEQMELQALSLMCQFKPAISVTTRLVYLDSGEQEFGEFSAKDREALKAKWEGKVAPMFADTTFAPRPSEKCRWCAYAKGKGGQCKFG